MRTAGVLSAIGFRKRGVSGKDVCVADRFTKTAMNRAKLEEFITTPCEKHLSVGTAASRSLRGWLIRRRQDCSHHERCYGRSKLKRHTIRRHVDFAWPQKHRARVLEPEYQERLEKWRLIERILGHLRHNRSVRRVPLRRLSGARSETFLVAAASALRWLCNILKRGERNCGSLMRTPELVGPRVA